MIIQKILGPNSACSEWELFFRGITKTEENLTSGIRIPAGKTLSLESYFNAFSIGKWTKYTGIEDLSLSLKIEGDCQILPMLAVGKKTEASQQYVETEIVTEGISADRRPAAAKVEEGKVTFTELPSQGVLYVEIKAESDCVFYGGAWETETQALNPVELVLGICTFKREEFVKRNVGGVLQDLIWNGASPLYGHLEIYISDNGQTLAQDVFSDEHVHLFPNKNAGGAGGFTRTMIESLFYRKNSPFTHIILMDDDIVLSADVLERTYLFLTYLRPEYKDCMLGGEMFELGRRYVQFEAGAKWQGINVTFYNKNWDLRQADCVSANEIENPINYSGWWYSCIPTSIITKENLPIPLFIHYDDIEYGVRNEAGTILLNGICVWHPQGIAKAPISMNYYDVRNMTLCMCRAPYCATAREMVTHLTNRIIGDVIRYRYEAADRVFEAFDDFFKGPEYFMALDPIENHQRLMAGNYVFLSPEEAGVDLKELVCRKPSETPKGWFIWDAFCWILPKFKKIRVCSVNDAGLPYTAGSIYFYDEDKQKGYLVKREYKKAWACFIRYWKTRHKIKKEFNNCIQRWAEAKPDFTSLAYWESYLNLN